MSVSRLWDCDLLVAWGDATWSMAQLCVLSLELQLTLDYIAINWLKLDVHTAVDSYHKESPCGDLEEQGDPDQHHHGDVILEFGALLKHSLQLGGIGHQESHVQHALCHTLLSGIMVQIDGTCPFWLERDREEDRQSGISDPVPCSGLLMDDVDKVNGLQLMWSWVLGALFVCCGDRLCIRLPGDHDCPCLLSPEERSRDRNLSRAEAVDQQAPSNRERYPWVSFAPCVHVSRLASTKEWLNCMHRALSMAEDRVTTAKQSDSFVSPLKGEQQDRKGSTVPLLWPTGTEPQRFQMGAAEPCDSAWKVPENQCSASASSLT
ncbi:hypothetical protein JZ751_024141 [Albula glossodonta]|uniref:Uncharacterized protein n=1 Tax=Albula glossodonta TaxID=121402 RepID=A0A8T2NIM1_9TELE|nr:hypothetical protein JZ751_024141 [Albula glossodonta]